jgi:nucleoside-diphosphate-sugar epimerase
MGIYRFIKWVDEGQPLVIYGDGEQSRDFTYVEDIARGTVAAAKPFGYEIINLGGGRSPVTVNQVVKWIEEGLGKKAKVVHKPVQKADLTDTQADIRKAARLLAWVPQTEFREGLNRTIAWHLENRTLVSQMGLGH